VSGTATTVSADASDDVAVVGVQFKLDGANLGAEDTSAPYSISWNTTTATNTGHTLTAVARDAAGNRTTSTGVDVTVSNPTPPPSGLVAAYSFNAGTGTTAVDSSGKGNTGTLANAAWTAGGKFGGALFFNGSSSWVTVPDASSLDLTTGMTLEAWVSPNALGTSWRTVVFKERPSGVVYSLYANQDTRVPLGQVYIKSERNAPGTASLALNTWAHLAVTYDGSNLRLYVNGTLVRTTPTTGSMSNSNRALRIGGNSTGPQWFGGLIDEVRVYNRALTATEIGRDMTTAIG
jgi:YD repeat-containing protein